MFEVSFRILERKLDRAIISIEKLRDEAADKGLAVVVAVWAAKKVGIRRAGSHGICFCETNRKIRRAVARL